MPFSRLTASLVSRDRTTIDNVANHFVTIFEAKYPKVAEALPTSPANAYPFLEDVELLWADQPLSSACSIAGKYSPGRIIVYDSGNAARNAFTVFHELGHHLVANDVDYQFQVASILSHQQALVIEEDVADAFAAAVLMPRRTIDEIFHQGITATGVLELIDRTQASASACAVQALRLPGERLIFLSSKHDGIFFASSTGEPFNPGRTVAQPAIVNGAEKARANGGKHQFTGGEGVRYSSGNVNARVAFDIAVNDSLVVTIVTPEGIDSRVSGSDTWLLTCSHCLADFDTQAVQRCVKCGKLNECPECGSCSCTQVEQVPCSECFTLLSVDETVRNLTAHEECP